LVASDLSKSCRRTFDWLQSPDPTTEVPSVQPVPPTVPPWRRWRTVLVTSLGGYKLSAGGAIAGVLQSWELKSYDQLQRLRPSELPDARILLVGADEEIFVNTSIRYPMPFWRSLLKNWSNIDPSRSDWIFFATNLYPPVMIHLLLS
jgi:hypothetical protein